MERSPQQELIYDNFNYLSGIQSVAFHPSNQEAALPIIELHSADQLQLAFDDLRGDIRNLYFSIEHCNAQWKSSQLSALEFANGFNEERITTYSSSVNTLQPYTHYELQFPTREVTPKLAGNYLLKVYEDADKRRLILTRRFYVVNPLFSVTPQVIPSFDVGKRSKNQKINVKVNTGGVSVSNPHQDMQLVVMQNQRPDAVQRLRTPMFISQHEISYNDNTTLDFSAGNEFRYVDLRSLRLASERVADIATDTITHVRLFTDKSQANATYASTFDENGAYYIRNQDRVDEKTESEYAWVYFTLSDADVTDGAVHIVGGFNDYRRDEASKLTYNAASDTWEAKLFLKQGLYDYDYVHVDVSGNIQPYRFSGSHFETGNSYQILVYHRRPTQTWDELLGYVTISTGR